MGRMGLVAMAVVVAGALWFAGGPRAMSAAQAEAARGGLCRNGCAKFYAWRVGTTPHATYYFTTALTALTLYADEHYFGGRPVSLAYTTFKICTTPVGEDCPSKPNSAMDGATGCIVMDEHWGHYTDCENPPHTPEESL